LPSVSGKQPEWKWDYEYKRNGTLLLLAGIDLHDEHILGIVRERHRSREFIEFLQCADSHYPHDWKIRIILDNHSSHVSKETMSWLKIKPNRFEFVYTPKHGSWLNIVEVFFSKMTRTFLRFLRVSSKDELKERIEQFLDEVNAAPAVSRWKNKMDEVLV
jgi:transposase